MGTSTGMKYSLLLVWILVCSAFGVSAQDTVVLVNNAGVATYLNKNAQINFSVSFKGDTIYDTGIRSGAGLAFMVDSTFVQVTRFKIPDNKILDKFDAKKERALLDHFRKYELEYFQEQVFLSPLKNESMFFENSWGKQFQLWGFETPLLNRHKEDIKESDSVMYRSMGVKHNLFLSFVANGHVIMINMLVLEHESKEAKITVLKEQVANNIRIFAGPIMEKELQEQIVHHELAKEYDVYDSTEGLKFIIPYWLNLMHGPYYFHGVFPDINNISNALVMILIDKSKYASLEDFKDQWTQEKRGEKRLPGVVKSNNSKLSKYNFYANTSYGRFQTQRVLFETKASYGVINFTATDGTFDKNITRFEEFLNKMEIDPF